MCWVLCFWSSSRLKEKVILPLVDGRVRAVCEGRVQKRDGISGVSCRWGQWEEEGHSKKRGEKLKTSIEGEKESVFEEKQQLFGYSGLEEWGEEVRKCWGPDCLWSRFVLKYASATLGQRVVARPGVWDPQDACDRSFCKSVFLEKLRKFYLTCQ